MTESEGPDEYGVVASDLREAVQHVLSHHFEKFRHVASIRRSQWVTASSFMLEELVVVFDDGGTFELLFKNVGLSGLMADARRAKPMFMLNPSREPLIYARLNSHALGTPRFYGSVVQPENDRYWLFMEKVGGSELWQVGDVGVWERVAMWLQTAHEFLAGSVPEVDRKQLVQHDADFYLSWAQRAIEFSPERSRDAVQRLAERYPRAVECLTSLPVTPIHGEFFVSNILVGNPPGTSRICVVDWEMAGLGPASIDIAAFTTGVWTEEQRKRLARPYFDNIGPGAEWRPDWNQFISALDCSYLHLSFQCLGWSPDWVPAPRKAHDWLSEAQRAADRLAL